MNIISVIKGLEGEVETAFKLKNILEVELETTQQRLSEEMEARAQLGLQVNSLQARTTLTEQLRQDISFVEEERNKLADEVAQTRQKLEQIIDERDSLAEHYSQSEGNLAEVDSEKRALEAQVMNLKNNISDALQLRNDLAEATQAHQQVREVNLELTRRLETTAAAKNDLETQLMESRHNTQTLRGEADQLRRKNTKGDSRTADLRIQLEDQQAANHELMEFNAHLGNEIKTLKIDSEAVKNELNAFKKVLRDIRTEATRTSGHVRKKYFKPTDVTSREH